MAGIASGSAASTELPGGARPPENPERESSDLERRTGRFYRGLQYCTLGGAFLYSASINSNLPLLRGAKIVGLSALPIALVSGARKDFQKGDYDKLFLRTAIGVFVAARLARLAKL